MSGDICGCHNRRGEVLLARGAATRPTYIGETPMTDTYQTQNVMASILRNLALGQF